MANALPEILNTSGVSSWLTAGWRRGGAERQTRTGSDDQAQMVQIGFVMLLYDFV